MNWLDALILGLVQGLTEFLPVSSSGHLIIFQRLLGVSSEGFLDFTVTVHMATVFATIVVFREQIWALIKGVLQFKYNDEMDYFLKIAVSMIPVFIVGVFLRETVERMFTSFDQVGIFLIATGVILVFSDLASRIFIVKDVLNNHRNGISYLQAIFVGMAQACAVAPGLSRSGTTIAIGLVSGVKRSVVAQFSFLMVLVPIIGEQLISVVQSVVTPDPNSYGMDLFPLFCGFMAAFISGLFACKVMIAIVKKASLYWFSFYCFIVGGLIVYFA
ncbi:MAG: undecaprenyl-diphosphate phosphatase [Bacteroidales bacterium]|nr:undecaprenyl-diphosphate phosphatase [Bacteroidales bacterium]